MNPRAQLIRHVVLGTGLPLVAALSLSGCLSTKAASSTSTSSIGSNALPSTVPTNCNVAASTVTAKTPTFAVLAQTGHGVTDYTSDLATVIGAGKTSGARIIVNGVGDPSTAPDAAADYVLTGDGPNPAFRKHNLQCKTALVSTAVTHQLSTVSSPAHPDLFHALNVLSGNLTGNPSKKPIDVLLFTSLVAKGGGVDLSNPKTLANPREAINTLARQGLIPTLRNVRLYAVRPDRNLTDAQAAELKTFWRLYATKAKAQLVAWTDHLSQFPLNGAIQAADTSQLPIHRDRVKIVATLGGDVTFNDGKANLRAAAQAELAQVLPLTRQGKGRIEIDGYTDIDTGEGPTYLHDLSTRRAQAVANWLIAHGVAAERITPAGHGADDPVHPNPTSPAQHAANRRVVATIFTR